MKIIIACILSFAVSAITGKFLVPELRKLKAGQSIREDGPTWHAGKAGTPTMGGLMFILGIFVSILICGWKGMMAGDFKHLYIFFFALIFGGTLRSALAAALAGFLASGYLLLCGRHDLPGGFCKISCAALITLACILGCSLLGTSASHAIIGSLMILTPGIAFTMGIRDFVQGDYLSGTIRMIDALLIAASIAIGTGLVLSLYTFFTGVVVA